MPAEASPQNFLRELIAEKRAVNPALSVRAIAKRAGFRSPSTLSMILSGQRTLSLKSAEKIADAITLRGRRRSLLLAYARQSSAKTSTERRAAEEAVLKIKSISSEFALRPEQFSFLAHWYYPVLCALAGKEGLPGSDQLAKALGRGLRTSEIDRAIEDLAKLGLLRKNENGKWVQDHYALTTPDEVRDFAARKYHRNMNALAGEALDLPLEKREFNGLTIRISKDQLFDVKEKVRRFRSELNELLSASENSGEVYQVNLQIFPLTDGLEKNP